MLNRLSHPDFWTDSYFRFTFKREECVRLLSGLFQVTEVTPRLKLNYFLKVLKILYGTRLTVYPL